MEELKNGEAPLLCDQSSTIVMSDQQVEQNMIWKYQKYFNLNVSGFWKQF